MATPIPPNRARVTTEGAARASGGKAIAPELGRAHAGVFTDSRAVVPGSVFVAIRGESHDGHAFLESAVQRGATLLIVARNRAPNWTPSNSGNVDVIEVDDTVDALGAIAHDHLERWRGRDGRKVIAITGSVGKTTTKELCAALLAQASGRSVRATDGNLNNRIGVPAMIFTLDDQHAFAVLECGMSLRGEMEKLAAIALPDVAAVTNVGMSHAENVGGTREGVAIEKGALYRGSRTGATLVVSADDAFAAAQAATVAERARISFGRAASADVRLEQRVGRGFSGSTLRVVRAAAPVLDVELPIVGEGAALDFVCALACAEAALERPLSAAEIAGALGGLPPSPGRAHVRTRDDGAVVVDDTYNASPQSMENALQSLSELAQDGRRAVCVLGEMRELGPVAESAHDELGDTVARAGVSLFIGCGGLIGRSLERARARGVRVIAAADASEAAAIAMREVTSRDVVLVKGSRAIGTERVVVALLGAEAR